MVRLFEEALIKEQLDPERIIEESIFFKNVVVEAKQAEINAVIYLQGIPTAEIINHCDLFLKEEEAFIVIDEFTLRKYLKTCSTIIIFPQSLAQIGEHIHAIRKRLRVFVIKMDEIDREGEAYIVHDCNDLAKRNGRLTITPNIPYASALKELI